MSIPPLQRPDIVQLPAWALPAHKLYFPPPHSNLLSKRALSPKRKIFHLTCHVTFRRRP
ncbi:MAG: hypothetical protein ACTS6G_03675 [Candidatus Hodgkinia cicadicola]